MKNLTEKQMEFSLRIFDLIIARILKKVHSTLDESSKKILEAAFASGTEKEKDEAVKKYIPNFKKLFEEEAKKIEEEIKEEIKKQI